MNWGPWSPFICLVKRRLKIGSKYLGINMSVVKRIFVAIVQRADGRGVLW
jgi:hypothetical protein